jgi:peptide/nickel transport system permease protein
VTTYVLKRLLLMIPTLFGISVITFGLSRAMPGDPVSAEFGGGGGAAIAGGSTESMKEREARAAALRKELGLDKPIPIQYLRWVGKTLRGDFGRSTKYDMPVAKKIWDAMGVTIQLNAISLLLVYLIAVPLGIHAAIRRGELEEKAIGVTLFGLYSAPSFWVATLLLFYLANPAYLQLWDGVGLRRERYEQLPYVYQLKDYLWNLVLPVICLTYGGLAGLSRYARSGMLEVLRRDYIRTARAKGLPERVVILKHALRNSLIPIVTLMANLLPAMISGSVVVEVIFTINGMGKLQFEAVLSRDYDMIMAAAMLAALLTLVGMLIADLLYTVVDPRISLE